MNSVNARIILLFFNSLVFTTQNDYEPLAIVNHKYNGALARPSERNIREYLLQEEENLLCFCPTTNPKSPLRAQGHPVPKICEPLCSKEPVPVVQIIDESEKCSLNGVLLTVAYTVDIDSSFKFTINLFSKIYPFEVINYCYDVTTKQVFFVEQRFLAPYHLRIENAETSILFKDYKTDNYMYEDPVTFYEEENQENSFRKIFNDDYVKYFKRSKANNESPRYFVPQQLVEPDDLVLETWKKGTYYFLNTAPLWKSVKEGSWKKANQYIRKLARMLKTEFIGYSGTFEQLTIDNKPIYLSRPEYSDRIAVPKIFWKFLRHMECHLGLIIVIYNDIDNPPNEPKFCKVTPCPKLGEYELHNMENPHEGYVHCCLFDATLPQKLNLQHLNLHSFQTLDQNLIDNYNVSFNEICEDKDPNEDDWFNWIPFVIVASEQRGNEFPLAFVKNGIPGTSGLDLAMPDPYKKDKHKFFVGQWKTLICACPPPHGESHSPLIPIKHERPFRCPPFCQRPVVPEINTAKSPKCGFELHSRSVGYTVKFGETVALRGAEESGSTSIFSRFNRLIQYWHTTFVNIINFCHNKENKVLFAVHKLRASDYLQNENDDPTSNQNEYKSDFCLYENPVAFYEKKNQQKVFQDLFPRDSHKHLDEEDESDVKYFVMQQLVESADMAIHTWKLVTYYYINTIPMWFTISRGSWRRANRYIRTLSQLLDIKFLIYTGTYNQLEINGKPISLSHAKDKETMPVPAIVWKYIFDESANRGVVIVIYNDIYNPPENPTFCVRTKCLKIGQRELENFQNPSEGFMHCCRMNKDLRKKLNLDQVVYTNIETLNNDISSLQHSAYDLDSSVNSTE